LQVTNEAKQSFERINTDMNNEVEKIESLISLVRSETADFRISEQPSKEIIRILTEISEKLSLGCVSKLICPDCGCNKMQDDANDNYTCLNIMCDWKGKLFI